MTKVPELNELVNHLIKVGAIHKMTWHISTRILFATYIKYKLKRLA